MHFVAIFVGIRGTSKKWKKDTIGNIWRSKNRVDPSKIQRRNDLRLIPRISTLFVFIIHSKTPTYARGKLETRMRDMEYLKKKERRFRWKRTKPERILVAQKSRERRRRWRGCLAGPNATYQYTWVPVMGQYRISGPIHRHLLRFVRSK